MKKYLVILFVAFLSNILANDGVFYMAGNQLIPIMESDISLTKEVLDIKKVDNIIKVRVHYNLHNPKKRKKLLVGFEAAPPMGDFNDRPSPDGQHPFIHNFSVVMNGDTLDYKTALVSKDSTYFNGKNIKGLDQNQIKDFDEYFDYYYFMHVYHFDASFKKGNNEIIHEYEFDVSATTMERYLFDYVLTAANRWANNQIDDFTLNLVLGSFQEVGICNTFFDYSNQWNFQGKAIDEDVDYPCDSSGISRFFLPDAKLSFHQKNFHPKGELLVFSPLNFPYYDDHQFNYKEDILTYDFSLVKDLRESIDANSYSILRSYPYALRGTIFKINFIQEYYESMDWYKRDYNYKADPSTLTKEETEWIENLKK